MANLVANQSANQSQSTAQNIIEVRNLYTKYKDRFIQENVSFSVKKAEIFGILGGSGSGKSTLLSTMICLKRPEKGQIRIFGEDIWSDSHIDSRLDSHQNMRLDSHENSRKNSRLDSRPNLHQSAKDLLKNPRALLKEPQNSRDKILKRCGVLFQFGALFSSLSVIDNVGIMLEEYSSYPKSAINEIAQYCLNIVGLPQYVNDMFPYELSGGMKKRVGLARALAFAPEILFLDEPTSGLDPQSAENFDKLIIRLRDEFKLTIIMVTHDLDSIKDATDRFILLDSGKIIFEGSLEAFRLSESANLNTLLKSKRGERLWKEE